MKWNPLIPLIFVSVVSWSAPVAAHGTKIEYRTTEAIAIDAKYDTGEPMSEAQVTVYAPDDPSTPWLQGTADANGNFLFTPDPSKPGNWTVRVRQAGHGDIINIAVAEDPATSQEATVAQDTTSTPQEVNNPVTRGGFTPLQTILMGAAVVWGFVGTALFFSRGKNRAHS